MINLHNIILKERGGSSTIVFAMILLTLVGSYEIYSRGTKITSSQLAARTMKELSLGEVFANKIINRVINIVKDGANAECINGTDIDINPESKKFYLPHRYDSIMMVFYGEEPADPADYNSYTDDLDRLYEQDATNIWFAQGVADPSHKKTRECLVYDHELKGVKNFYIKIVSIYEERTIKRVEIQVAGHTQTNHGGSGIELSFNTHHTVNIFPVSLKELGFVFNHPGKHTSQLIEIIGNGNLKFDTPVYVNTVNTVNTNKRLKLEKIIKSESPNDWQHTKLKFLRNFFIKHDAFDISNAKSLGKVRNTFVKGISTKALNSYTIDFEEYLPTNDDSFGDLLYEPVNDDPDHVYETAPLDLVNPDSSIESGINHGTSERRIINMANAPHKALDSRQDIEYNVQLPSHSCLKRSTYPLVISTNNTVTITFPSNITDDRAYFCGLIMANELIIKGGAQKKTLVMYGAFVVNTKLKIEVQDSTVEFKNINNTNVSGVIQTYLSFIPSNPYAWYFFRDFNKSFLFDDNNVKINDKKTIFFNLVYNSRRWVHNDPNSATMLFRPEPPDSVHDYSQKETMFMIK